MVPSEGVLGGSEQATHHQSSMVDGQDFLWDSSGLESLSPTYNKEAGSAHLHHQGK